MSGNSTLLRGPADYFQLGTWNARCDQCYRKVKSYDLRQRWDNAMCCWTCWEIRNPQDFVQGIPDNQRPPWLRPNPPPVWAPGVVNVSQMEQPFGGSQLVNGQMVGASLLG